MVAPTAPHPEDDTDTAIVEAGKPLVRAWIRRPSKEVESRFMVAVEGMPTVSAYIVPAASLVPCSGMTPNHLRVQSRLLMRGEALAASAGVAQLLEGQNVEKVLATARRSFTYVQADKLLRNDMADNNPNPALSGLTTTGHLGEADAFFSHSWQDDPELKWAAMQQWRETFKQKNGREPKLWIDKYSIDQSSINDSLACLPVYLAGCKKLLIVCGNTYLKRLWCLVEIFVFLQVGGKMSDVEVILLDDVSPGLAEQITQFDPREACCFSADDSAWLHWVIGSAGYDQIRELIKNVFTAAPWHTSK